MSSTDNSRIDDILTANVRSSMKSEGSRNAGRGRYSYTVTESDRDATVRQVMKRRLGFSNRLINKFKRGLGTVRRNGLEVRTCAEVVPGDVIDIKMPEDVSHFEAQDIPVSIIYEDEDILLVNKQAGLVVHPTKNVHDGTLANGLMKKMIDRGERYKIRFVNRLDMDTSGIVIVSKNAYCQDALSKMMKLDRVRKYYFAVVHGRVEQDEGSVDAPIGRGPADSVRRAVTADGSPSVTHYRVLRRFAGSPDYPEGFTSLELRLETGRTHQIRVHMSYKGHPLVGDPLYGRSEPELIGRQALHAERIVFPHPVDGRLVDVEAPLPEDIEQLIRMLESMSAGD